ncbi:MAG: hypothetical protein H0X31_00930 [Nostocaceae cyanobacterium]|nr:hypothetical protein [Nostocaceae cyanobacterium]
MPSGKEYEEIYLRLMKRYIECTPDMRPDEMFALSRACFKFGADLHLMAARQIDRFSVCEPPPIETERTGEKLKNLLLGKWVTGESNHNTLD